METSLDILKKYWGHQQFRPLQQSIIEAVLNGDDVLALLPTGGGKSICFQIPAMLLDGVCIVISPLIALMKDQIEHLNNKGIHAAAIYSGMSFFEVNKILQNACSGAYKFLYVSPERLETKLFKDYILSLHPCIIAVDEAHCISQWGYDFRPAYIKIALLREEMPKVPIVALTASATLEVQNDICKKLLFSKNHRRFQQSFSRPNLSYSFIQPESKESMLIDILKKKSGSSIVYCKSRKQTQQIADLLKSHKINADFYHAGLTPEERMKKQMKWMNNEIESMICTNAFGMGIDKSDVRWVIHLHMPENIESYYQEAGRAGRDGKKSNAILLFHQKEADHLLALNSLKYPSPLKIKTIYLQLMNYLQVDAGVGEGLSFDFDIGQFARISKLNILEADYGLKTLTQEGLVFFLEKSSKPSELVFIASKATLFDFKINKPEFEDIINTLLRKYEGIFDYPCPIYESMISKIISQPIDAVKKQLKALHHYQIVEYKTPSNTPQIILLKNRMYADDFTFDYVSLKKRSEKNIDRINSMIDFVSNKNKCRSQYIGNYFNDMNISACGICDVCISQKENAINTIPFKTLSNQILADLKKNNIPAVELETRYQHVGKLAIEKTIYFLQSERIIEIDDNGNIMLIK